MSIDNVYTYDEIVKPENKDWLEKLKPHQWQIDILKKNVSHKKGFWERGESDSVEDWKTYLNDYDSDLSDYDVIDYSFVLTREVDECLYCSGLGVNRATYDISNKFFKDGNENGWGYHITEDELSFLKEHAYIRDNNLTLEDFYAGRNHIWRLSGVAVLALAEERAKKTGVYGQCEHCHGEGDFYLEENAHIELHLWMSYPRKSLVFELYINLIEEEDISSVMTFLKKAADDNAKRFANIDK